MIGIVGGVGPLAGLDVFKKIIEETEVETDQDHLPVLLMSYPHKIVDRTEYIIGKVNTNPGFALADIIRSLAANGAKVAAIPCNTAHAQPIFSVIESELEKSGTAIKLLHLVKETAKYIGETSPQAKVAVLSTTGTHNTGLYKNNLEENRLEVVELSDIWQERVHEAIYSRSYGLKAFSSPVKHKAVEELTLAMDELIKKGATHFVLGCTELPLALTQSHYKGLPLIDPNRIIARSLINAVSPEKLKQ
ncbi:aspartate/glutamate racemase family protein [Pedobacter montanisoli]|uniref:Amino acid racemase n=1 Tax=Pedobacter montanisoli TaxID=2923277 RepID=A0ABS9ZZQ6_9SPHI|nr:amino acid racemase [Pedobacter montanisoli]MCJ0743764.1 amino acid racemase [Pedobacter montanisoli]